MCRLLLLLLLLQLLLLLKVLFRTLVWRCTPARFGSTKHKVPRFASRFQGSTHTTDSEQPGSCVAGERLCWHKHIRTVDLQK